METLNIIFLELQNLKHHDLVMLIFPYMTYIRLLDCSMLIIICGRVRIKMSIAVTAKCLSAGTDNAQVNNDSQPLWLRESYSSFRRFFLVLCSGPTSQYEVTDSVTVCLTAVHGEF